MPKKRKCFDVRYYNALLEVMDLMEWHVVKLSELRKKRGTSINTYKRVLGALEEKKYIKKRQSAEYLTQRKKRMYGTEYVLNREYLEEVDEEFSEAWNQPVVDVFLRQLRDEGNKASPNEDVLAWLEAGLQQARSHLKTRKDKIRHELLQPLIKRNRERKFEKLNKWFIENLRELRQPEFQNEVLSDWFVRNWEKFRFEFTLIKTDAAGFGYSPHKIFAYEAPLRILKEFLDIMIP